jgi:hypothetical protein
MPTKRASLLWLKHHSSEVTAGSAILSTFIAIAALAVTVHLTNRSIAQQENLAAPVVYFDTTEENKFLVKNFGSGTALNVYLIEYKETGEHVPIYWAALGPGESKPPNMSFPKRGVIMYSGTSPGYYCHFFEQGAPTNLLGFQSVVRHYAPGTNCSKDPFPFDSDGNLIH